MTIRKILIALILVTTAGVLQTSSQGIDLMPYAGSSFAYHFNLKYGGTATIQSGFVYGGMISKTLGKHMSVDFLYSGLICDGSYLGTSDYNTGDWIPNDSKIPLSCRYLQLGVTRTFPIGKSEIIQGFAGLNAGYVTFVPGRDYDKKKMLAPGIRTGIKVWPSKRIGLLFQASLQSPFQRMGTTMFASNSGNSIGVQGLTFFPQVDLSGGAIIRISK